MLELAGISFLYRVQKTLSQKKLFTNFHQIQQVATAMNPELSALKLSTSFHLTRVHTHLIMLRETKL